MSSSVLNRWKEANFSAFQMNGVSSPATMSSNSSVSGGGDEEDNNAADTGALAEKHRKFRKKRLGRPPKDSPARWVVHFIS